MTSYQVIQKQNIRWVVNANLLHTRTTYHKIGNMLEKYNEKGQENPQEDFEYSKINGNDIRITKFKGTGSKVVIPAQIEGYTVKELGNSVFANNHEVKSE